MWEIIQKEKEAAELVTLEQSNDKTRQFGLQLTTEQAKELIVCRNESLQKYRRLELGEGILDKLIFFINLL